MLKKNSSLLQQYLSVWWMEHYPVGVQKSSSTTRGELSVMTASPVRLPGSFVICWASVGQFFTVCFGTKSYEKVVCSLIICFNISSITFSNEIHGIYSVHSIFYVNTKFVFVFLLKKWCILRRIRCIRTRVWKDLDGRGHLHRVRVLYNAMSSQ